MILNNKDNKIKTIGIIGGGQLGRMLSYVARRMGYRVVSWTGSTSNDEVSGFSNEIINKEFNSDEGFNKFIKLVDVVTIEFENIPKYILDKISSHVPLHPNPQSVAICQDRNLEKNFLLNNDIPCVKFFEINSKYEIKSILSKLDSNQGIIKTIRLGYDGKGQMIVSKDSDINKVWLRFKGQDIILEEKVNLKSEFSILIARSKSGEIVCYDPIENIHENHILDTSIMPSKFDKLISNKAVKIAEKIVAKLNYVGILAVEFFLTNENDILVNEMAPRTHNSGHLTIEACETSQFEQQLRAICDLPLGSTKCVRPSVMHNLLGNIWGKEKKEPNWSNILYLPGINMHLYEKKEAIDFRKMGHITISSDTIEEALSIQKECKKRLSI